jgi:hypothetical protein
MLVVVVHPPTFPVYQRMPAHGDRIWASEPTAEVVRKRQPSRSRAFAAGARAASDLTTRKRLHAWQTSHGTQIDAAIGPWYGQKHCLIRSLVIFPLKLSDFLAGELMRFHGQIDEGLTKTRLVGSDVRACSVTAALVLLTHAGAWWRHHQITYIDNQD